MGLEKLLYALINIIHLVSLSFTSAENGALKNYIIHVKKQSDALIHPVHHHKSFLSNTDQLLHSYKHVISGFSARLSAAEVDALTRKEGFISAHQERIYKLSTTRSPSFLGLQKGTGLWNLSNQGHGVIIGVLDTGVLPSHPSFSDEDMPISQLPARWNGKCLFPTECNNKLIGARSFISGNANVSEPPFDYNGHGTHTASTAAGAFVQNACLLGSACGTAAGTAPHANLAIYKVCTTECSDIDTIAGIDTAIEDGVDVLSMSLGVSQAPFYSDHIAIALFAAVQKGIFVSCSAGNDGPTLNTLSNVAPWILTAGASTIDRSLRAIAKQGDEQEFIGETVFQPKNFTPTLLPPVYGGSCTHISIDVKGKVVLCDGSRDIYPLDQSQKVQDAGGVAAILPNMEPYGFSTLAEAHILPATEVSYLAGEKIKAYINSTKSPTATILFKGTLIGDDPLAPTVSGFSSRGPSSVSPGILKPDIIGPGVNILAAWPFSFDTNVDSKLTFAVLSGTSMSTRHLSGVAALLKSVHPNWSPASIKSAIMTTADTVNVGKTAILDEKLTPADVFATGAGHVNPSKANDPGLVYNMTTDDYIPYLCGLGYTDQQVEKIVHKSVNCTLKNPEGQLNYPTFSVSLGPSQTFTRTVTNVGAPFSYYFVKTVVPHGVNVIVKPRTLWFTRVNQKATYSVTFSRRFNTSHMTYSQGYLQWLSRKHSVKSAISVEFTVDSV